MSARELRVLVVEDSPDDCRLVRAELRRGGYEPAPLRRVDSAAGFAEALEEDWDVILSDYQMPSFTARDALEMLLKSGKDIPFIVVSGSIGEDIAVDMMKAGAHDYFRKENMARLVPAIERELGEAEHRRRRRALEAERDRLLEQERQARAEAEAANRLKDEFLATLSHELRTPLNAVLGWAQLLRTGSREPAAQLRALETIERNARALAQLVEDLLDVSRIISGKLVLRSGSVALPRVVEAAAEVLRHAAAAKRVTVELHLDPAAGPVTGDPDRLQQVAWNLLSNAIKFTPEGGRVSVTLTRERSSACLRVRDTGQGIPPSFLAHVFDRFQQLDSSASRKHGGLGLGLAIVRHLVELHGGSVSAESEGKGKGATFTVSLPIRAIVTPEPGEEPGSPAPRLEGLRVLVVDDDADARELVRVALELQGAEVTAVDSAQEALRELRAWRPAVLVSDIAMPGMDGYSLIREARKLPPEEGGWVPALALTAYAAAEDTRRVMLAGFQIHVPKPIDPARLVRVVAELAGWHHP